MAAARSAGRGLSRVMGGPGALTEAELRAAWNDVLDNDREDGEISSSVDRFASDVDEQLSRLAECLSDGSYEPSDLFEVSIPKDDGVRILHVPAVRDRVVERALLDRVTPLVDPWLGAASFAYRPGLGVADAVQAVARLRDEGGAYVLRSDVDDCFPSVPVSLALRLFDALVPNGELQGLVRLLLARMARHPRRGRKTIRGLPQGCALSPLLANLVLTHLDDPLLERGFPLVRYADDFVVVTATAAEAWESARVATTALEAMRMQLGPDKTEVMSFDEGFCFLGEDFGLRYPPTLESHRVVEPEKRVVYVGLQGARVSVRSGRLAVHTYDDHEMLSVPTSHVARIVCFGSVGVTAGARSWAMANQVDTVFTSRRGSYLGHLVSASAPSRVRRLRAQLLATEDPARAVDIARRIVDAKIAKQAVLLRRFCRPEHAEEVGEAIGSIRGVGTLLPDCSTLDEVRGIEGAAAAAYFSALGQMLPSDLRFGVRSRQPPLDVANAALSLLYTILLGECESAVRAAGLDPAIGFLHADKDRRPSLALDILEEFRPLVVDQVVVALARKGTLTLEHGRSETNKPGVLLTRAGREAVLRAYESRMLQMTRGAAPGFAGTIRRHVYRQAQRLAATVADPSNEWTGLSWR